MNGRFHFVAMRRERNFQLQRTKTVIITRDLG